jgi:hypothetical protein
MQEQIELFEAIQIGSMSLKLTPSGSSSFDPNLSTNYPPFSSLCHVDNLFENDKYFTDFHTDLIHRGYVLGSSPVRPRDACMQVVTMRDSSHSASALHNVSERREQRNSNQTLLGTPGKVAGGGSACSVQREQHGDNKPASTACVNRAGEGSGSGLPLHAPCASVGRARTDDGSSVVAAVVPSVPSLDFSPQKIRQGKTGGPGMRAHATANHEAMIANDLQSLLTRGGSSVAGSAAANGMGQNSKKIISANVNLVELSTTTFDSIQVFNDGNTCDLGLARKFKNGIMDSSMMNGTKEQGVSLQGSMGITSSPRTKGKVFGATSVSSKIPSTSCSLSLIENDTVFHYHSTEEVIAFGGIPKPTV